MENTPRSAKILANAMHTHGWEQLDLAEAAKIHRTTVSHHLAGLRPVRDDHLALYIKSLDKPEQAQLVSAWLLDTLPEAAAENIFESASHTLREDVRTWRPELTRVQQRMLDWWAGKLAAADELANIFVAISRKAGFPG